MNGIKHKTTHIKHWLAGLGILAGTMILLVLLAMIANGATNIWPNLGAGAVDLARGVVGDRPVSVAENFVLATEDKLKQIQYRITKSTPVAPWQTSTLSPSSPANTPFSNNPPFLTPTPSTIDNGIPLVEVGMALADHPPHGSGQAVLPHPALVLGSNA